MLKIGDFEIKSGKVIISDPCYKKNIDNILENIKKGKWDVFIKKGKNEIFGGYTNYELLVKNINYLFEGNEEWQVVNFDINVDSGQLGIYDEKYYRNNDIIEEFENKYIDYKEGYFIKDIFVYKETLEVYLGEYLISKKYNVKDINELEKDILIEAYSKTTKERINLESDKEYFNNVLNKLKKDIHGVEYIYKLLKERITLGPSKYNPIRKTNIETDILTKGYIGIEDIYCGEFNSENKWYYWNCSRTSDTSLKKDEIITENEYLTRITHAGIVPFGCVSRSGYGDGCYECFVVRKKNKIVAIKVIFIDED